MSVKSKSHLSPYKNSAKTKMLLILIFFISYSNIFTVSALNDGRDLVLNSLEKQALEKFKTQVSDLLPEEFMKSNFYLIRWVRVAELDLQRAKTLLLNNVNWRKKNNISSILTEDYSDLEEDFPITFEGHDKEFRPIMTLDFSEWDLRYAALQGKMPRLQRYLIQATERNMQNVFIAQRISRGSKPVTRSMVLVDAEGFNVVQHGCVQCMAALSSWAVVGDSYYPRFNDEVIVVNAPQAAVIALNTIRTVMSAELRNSIKIFNSNKRLWNQYLDKRIPRNQRTKRYGGTR